MQTLPVSYTLKKTEHGKVMFSVGRLSVLSANIFIVCLLAHHNNAGTFATPPGIDNLSVKTFVFPVL